MSLPLIESLEIFGPHDRGVPNQERIVLHPRDYVNLGLFGVLLLRESDDGKRTPCLDQIFWFGNYLVGPPIHVFLYTGPGQFRTTTVAGTSTPAWVFHWGKPTTIFADSRITPALVRFDAVSHGDSAKNLPQLDIHKQRNLLKR